MFRRCVWISRGVLSATIVAKALVQTPISSLGQEEYLRLHRVPAVNITHYFNTVRACQCTLCTTEPLAKTLKKDMNYGIKPAPSSMLHTLVGNSMLNRQVSRQVFDHGRKALHENLGKVETRDDKTFFPVMATVGVAGAGKTALLQWLAQATQTSLASLRLSTRAVSCWMPRNVLLLTTVSSRTGPETCSIFSYSTPFNE